jgi:hypothetical protein
MSGFWGFRDFLVWVGEELQLHHITAREFFQKNWKPVFSNSVCSSKFCKV